MSLRTLFAPAPLLWLALLLGAGCGDDAGPADGGLPEAAVDGATDGGSLVAPPNIPWLAEGTPPVMLAPCPPGWREVSGGRVLECDPYPEAGPAACAAGEAHFPGEPGCRPIGEVCPAGDYAATLPSAGTVLYVNADAAPGGDGSVAAPYASLSEVSWASLDASTTLALAKGSYDGTMPLRAGVQVIGACVAETTLTGLSSPVAAVVTVTNAGAAASVRNLMIAAPSQSGVVLGSGRSIELTGVLIAGAGGFGVVASDAGTTVALTDVVVRDSVATRPGTGHGVHLEDGAQLTATRMILTDNQDAGFDALGAGSAATVVDSVVQNTQPAAGTGRRAAGLRLGEGASVEATRFLIAGNQDIGVACFHEGTTVTLTDTVLRDTRSGLDRNAGRGISLQSGCQVIGTRLLVANNRDIAIFGFDLGSAVTLTDTVIRDTLQNESDGRTGRGLSIDEGVRVTATRLLVSGNREMSIFAAGDGADVTLEDVAVWDTASRASDDGYGHGVNFQDGAALVARRLLVSRSHAVGLLSVAANTQVVVTDVVVQETAHNESSVSHGNGMQAESGATLTGARVRVHSVAELGIVSVVDAVVELEDVSVEHVGQGACATGDCPPTSFGYGILAMGASMRISGFEISDAELCGALIAPLELETVAPALDLMEGSVAGSTIGACVQVDGYDLGRLSDDVIYVDNGTNLDSTMLPVPPTINPL